MTKYQVMPPLSDDQFEALKADIATAGVRVPIEVDEHGEVIDGHHRRAIAMELGIECPEVVIRGLEEFEKVDRAFVLNATRRHFNREQQRAVVVKSLKLHPRLADREHARRCGVSHPTVATVRATLEAAGQLESFTSRIGGDGKERSQKPAEDPPKEDGAAVVSAPSSAQPEGSGATSGSAPVGPEEQSPASEPAVPVPAETGVTSPAPAPKPVETAEAKAERERLEFRTDRTREFAEALVNLTMRLGKDPVAWYEQIYVAGVYEDRNLPQVADCFEPQSLHRLAAMLDALGEYLTLTGKTL